MMEITVHGKYCVSHIDILDRKDCDSFITPEPNVIEYILGTLK